MTLGLDNQNLESFVPVYDALPEKWEDARGYVVEQLKQISNGVNIRTIGWYLDTELLSGNAFYPGTFNSDNQSPQQYRTILRKVIPFGALIIGLNQRPHGITFDNNFTLIELYAAATRTGALAEPIPNGADTINMDPTNINITVAAAWDRCNAVIHYIQEL
jgi:hypothetical protein